MTIECITVPASKKQEPALELGLTFSAYEAIWPDALRQSKFKYLLRSAAHMNTEHKATDAMQLGNALDCAVFTPKEYAEKFGARGKGQRAPKDDPRIFLNPEEDRAVSCMAKALHSHPDAAPLLKGDTQVSLYWRTQGIECKGRPDVLIRSSGGVWIVDLKSTRDASEDSFPKDIRRFMYQFQAAFYGMGVKALHPDVRDISYFLIAVENTAPWGVNVYQLDDVLVEIAREKIENVILPRWVKRNDAQATVYAPGIKKVFAKPWELDE